MWAETCLLLVIDSLHPKARSKWVITCHWFTECNGNPCLSLIPLWHICQVAWSRTDTFPKGVSPKVKIIARLEWELAYNDIAVQHVSHHANGDFLLHDVKIFHISYSTVRISRINFVISIVIFLKHLIGNDSTVCNAWLR